MLLFPLMLRMRAGDLFQLFTFLLFNTGDAAGRALAGLTRKPVATSTLFTYAGARVLIVVGLAFCNVIPSRPWRLPSLLRYRVVVPS